MRFARWLPVLLLVAAPAAAQTPDSTCLRLGRAARDSLARLHLASIRDTTRITAYQQRAYGVLSTILSLKCVHPAPVVVPPPPPPVEDPADSIPPVGPPEPGDTTVLARALTRIGPLRSRAATQALGGGYARMDPLYVKWDSLRWAQDSSQWGGNYYDRGLIYYAQCERLANPLYCVRGDAIVLDYRRKYLAANAYKASPHWSQLDGVAVHYWKSGDDSSRIAVVRTAYQMSVTLPWLRTGNYTDARQQARALTAALLAIQVNATNTPYGGHATWPAALDAGITNILSQQSADGAWRYPVNTCDLSLNYMGAMLADAFIRLYETYRQDPRFPVAIEKTADFLWTQWRPNDAVPSFNYYEKLCVNQHGTGGPTATPDLTGLYTTLFAWLAKRNPTKYRAKSDAVFAAAMQGLYPQGSKQFNQGFAYSWRAVGYLP